MGWRGWYCLNYSLNQGFDLGLPTDGHDRTLMMLSYMDQALAEVPRFLGMPHMPIMRADSTAAHSKQVMNIIKTVFERAQEKHNLIMTPKMTQFYRDAMLGAWIHDMGEVIFELTTASDTFAMTRAERQYIAARKNALEDKIFIFACQLAIQAIETGKPHSFLQTIHAIREHGLAVDQALPPVQRIDAEINAISTAIDDIEAKPDFPKTLAPETERLMALYQRVETEVDFLHPFVKTLEAIEGQRYLQRNSADSATDDLARRRQPDAYPHYPAHDLSSDHEILSSIRRAERRIKDMFVEAREAITRANASGMPSDDSRFASAQFTLAKVAAAFTYGSIARQFTPKPEDYVGRAPEIIDRAPMEPKSCEKISLDQLSALRDQEMVAKRERHAAQPPDDLNAQFYSRARAGALYRAAEHLVCDGFTRSRCFIPNTACLLRHEDTPQIPPELVQLMQKIEQGTQRPITPIRSR